MEIQIKNGVETGRFLIYIWMTKQKEQSFILIMNLQFEQSLAQCGIPWVNLRGELNHMKAGFLTLVWRLTLANGSYLEYLHMVSCALSTSWNGDEVPKVSMPRETSRCCMAFSNQASEVS